MSAVLGYNNSLREEISMKISKYKVRCKFCGFAYEIYSSDSSEEFISELKDCPCGKEAEVELVEVSNDD